MKYLGGDARLVSWRDVSEQKRALEAQRESEERYRALFDRSLDCVILTDFNGNLLDANEATLNLLGYNALRRLSATPDARVAAAGEINPAQTSQRT